jgi:hypothetical protein
MLSLWMRWLFGFALAASVVTSGGAQVANEPSVKVIEELIDRAQRTAGPGTQTDVSDEALRAFAIGEKAQTYDAMMSSLGFVKHINRPGSVFFRRTDERPQLFGHIELRIILRTDPEDRITSVFAKIFFHTL